MLSSIEFIDYFNFVLTFCEPIHPDDMEAMTRFARIGVKPGATFDKSAYSEDVIKAIEEGIAEAIKKIQHKAQNISEQKNGWNMMEAFGPREFFKGDWLLRAGAGMAAIFANDKIEAFYPTVFVDGNGEVLNSKTNKYSLHFTKDEIPPAKYFWSVTMYDKRADGTAGYMIENPINRYLINSTTEGLVYDKDGGLTIYIQHEQPEGEKTANWLPAPAAPFYMQMRIYGPQESVMNNEWAPPAVQKVETAKYPDPLLTTSLTPALISKGLEADGYALGLMAYAWGYPLVRMEREMRAYIDVPDPKPETSYRAPLNQIGWARELATSRAKDMPTANNETLYMSSVVKLDEPYILSVPDTRDRYYVVNVFTMWHELEHYIGRCTTGTKPGRFVLVPPGWEGKLPADVKRLDVSTDKVWLWGRLHVLQGEPIKPIHELQEKFTLFPLSADGKKDFAAKPATLKPMPTIGDDELGFFKHLAFALKANTVKSVDEALFAQFERIGLTEGGFDPSGMSDEMRKGLLRGLADGPAAVTSAQMGSSTIRSGWIYTTGLDNFGFNYSLRTAVAGSYLGANGGKEAVYPGRFTDSDGNPLKGNKRYVIHFKKTPPVGAFWSLTMYNNDDKMLVENPINRYKVGADTPGLKICDDGSFDIPIQHNKPEGEFADNWLPAPKGDFYVILRLYQPSDAILSGEYVLPQLDRVK